MRVALTSVSVAFGDREVLSGVEAAFESPGSVALMGPSGSGKSTLLAVVAGLLRPDSGAVLHDPPLARPASWVVQSAPQLPGRTALDNVALGGLAAGLTEGAATRDALDTMARLDIAHLAEQKVSALSGGERQRVAVARAITSPTDLILADEPTASLDESSAQLVARALHQASELGKLVIVATHDARVAAHFERTLALRAGSLREAIG